MIDLIVAITGLTIVCVVMVGVLSAVVALCTLWLSMVAGIISGAIWIVTSILRLFGLRKPYYGNRKNTNGVR